MTVFFRFHNWGNLLGGAGRRRIGGGAGRAWWLWGWLGWGEHNDAMAADLAEETKEGDANT